MVHTYIHTMATMATTTTTTTTTAPAVEHIEHILLLPEAIPTPQISPLILPCSVQCPGDVHPDADADAHISELVLSCAAWRLGTAAAAACGTSTTWSGYEADESRAVSLGSGSISGDDGEGEEEWEDEQEGGEEGGEEGGKVADVSFSVLGDAVYASPDEYQDDDHRPSQPPTALTSPIPLPSTIPPTKLTTPTTPPRTPASETTALLLAATAIPAYTASPRHASPARPRSRGRKYKTNKARRMFHRVVVVRSPNNSFNGLGRPPSRMRYGPVASGGGGGGGGAYESFPSPEFEGDGKWRGGICRWFC